LTLTFLHITDTHISANPDYHPHWVHPSVSHPNSHVDALRQTIDNLPFDFDFILHTGDVCADPLESDYRMAKRLFENFRRPIYMVAGNHDSVEIMRDILHDGQQVHVLCDEHVALNGHYLITVDTNGIGDAHAPTVRDEQIDWFESQLERISKPMIMAIHHPLIPTGVRWIDYRMRVQNGEALHNLLMKHANRLCGVFHGHIHQPTNSYCDGILYVGSPSTWYNLQADPSIQTDTNDLLMPGGFNLVMVRENRTFIRRYVL